MLSTGLTVFASVLGIIVGISFQKYMNDRDKKFSAYIEMIEAIADSTQADKRLDAIRKFVSAKQKTLIYGSNEVIMLLSKMPELNASDPSEYDAFLGLIARMRKETSIIPFTKQISKELLRKILG